MQDPAEDDGDARVVALRQHRDVLRRKLPLTENEEVAKGHAVPTLPALLHQEGMQRTSAPRPLLSVVHREEARLRARAL